VGGTAEWGTADKIWTVIRPSLGVGEQREFDEERGVPSLEGRRRRSMLATIKTRKETQLASEKKAKMKGTRPLPLGEGGKRARGWRGNEK